MKEIAGFQSSLNRRFGFVVNSGMTYCNMYWNGFQIGPSIALFSNRSSSAIEEVIKVHRYVFVTMIIHKNAPGLAFKCNRNAILMIIS